ncbi:phosphoribosylamine--glycine ligase [Brassicibacter mesophilus]|uniref:phosphoribosylamine--glycine ligase n=1 Tax=Brassicibacter mesophilus TaxID=745119 RepID=UPI003D1A389F
MKVLIIGSGAREHAIVWKIAQSKRVSKIYCAPGNAGIQQVAECINIKDDDIETLVSFALKEKIELTVVGPEVPLVHGIVDKFLENGLKVFGPCKKAAMLEGSKRYSKEFMDKYDIPTAKFRSFTSTKQALEGLSEFNYPLVIKADGLAAGKGVVICQNEQEAKDTINSMLENKKFGESGNEIVIEEFLYGTEASLLCFVNGNKIIPMESARDYKRVFDGDNGLNTGGMGCFSPNTIFTEELEKRIKADILDRIIYGFDGESIDFRGVLFIGLMITVNGPKVIEFNVRMGDPETEVVLPRLESDIVDIFEKTIDGTLESSDLKWLDKKCVCVVAASGGYPESYEKNKVITGLENVDKDVMVFHAGTKRIEDKVLTNGGRVLTVTALADTIDEARRKAYRNIGKINFDGMHYRKDIAN